MVFLGWLCSRILARIGGDLVLSEKIRELFLSFPPFSWTGQGQEDSSAFLPRGRVPTVRICNPFYRRFFVDPMVRVCYFISVIARIRVLLSCLVQDCILGSIKMNKPISFGIRLGFTRSSGYYLMLQFPLDLPSPKFMPIWGSFSCVYTVSRQGFMTVSAPCYSLLG